jgi:hypothetical protein
MASPMLSPSITATSEAPSNEPNQRGSLTGLHRMEFDQDDRHHGTPEECQQPTLFTADLALNTAAQGMLNCNTRPLVSDESHS